MTDNCQFLQAGRGKFERLQLYTAQMPESCDGHSRLAPKGLWRRTRFFVFRSEAAFAS